MKKKMILALVALLSVTATFAKEENTNAAQQMQAYDMSFNFRKVAEALHLSTDQLVSMENVNKNFKVEMSNAATAAKEDREQMVKRAIENDVRNMRYVLTDDQYRRYLLLLNTTLENRGLK